VKGIGDDEFLEALHQALPFDKLQRGPHTLGIAVSGGVDSMALATLYANARGAQQLPDLHGFIIDHKARAESTEEARWVAEQLSNSKIPETTYVFVSHC
jgi:tRNA(Ile)-lysidine synthase